MTNNSGGSDAEGERSEVVASDERHRGSEPARATKRWQDEYKHGDRVEVLVIFADGARWCRARIWRVTSSGRAFHVKLDDYPASYTIDRKTEIRKRNP